ncbi:hypothetical protein F5B22DRAFT_589058 [Xylaria bambusicola]|uniref:uncharacterized protein n=1 Tax=Xylaria bambusicola TaxID=326684 RepID=UPI0020080446|nr:uncharacterized protein F5B22DRAFT_589058 [Xylaria bambusicola]KAI0526084.1 hypothetical protein F5B22DRAFT_589058 [Xylaria bambusicola]
MANPNRPNFIDLRSGSSNTVHTMSSRGLRSPRLHVAGEVPPALSPLDAFALQSRLLAKQLEESAKSGNRVSRLPPLTTESPLVVQGRSEYFRSLSYDSTDEQDGLSPKQPAGLGLTTEIETPQDRPRSVHPRMSRIPPTPDESIPVPPNPFKDGLRGRSLQKLDENNGMYGARREQSPGDLESEPRSAGPQGSIGRASPSRGRFPASPEKLTKTASNESASLVPPPPMFPKRSSSIMSAPLDTTFPHEENLSASFHSQPPRKLSSSSAFSGPVLASPIAHYQRSPSISSEASAPLPRPSFNFSRPLSRAGTPTLDAPSRQASSDSHPSFILADDTAHTPVSMHSDAFAEGSVAGGDPAPSYIYSKYSLPRGKSLQRNSTLFHEAESPSSSFAWEPPASAGNRQAPPSPPTRPSSSSSRYQDGVVIGDPLVGRPSLERSKLSTEMSADGEPSSNISRPSTRDSRLSTDIPRGRTLTSGSHDQAQPRARTPMSVSTSDSASTIKPARSQHSSAPTAAEMSPEEHLAKGIKCHEEGSVKESTYHLRLAALGGDPTGMLLYALACRHGWGMRPNQKEGVQWLRKAADIAGAEIAEDENHAKEGKTIDFMENKTRKAQFALSIYELGVSHMNGWGIEQDKALALRCFEISGSWGDVDALTEAGFCYAQGIGCKKDLKKSAKFYRMAEAKGMSMPGNSWIHKAKYNDDTSSIKSGKARSKSKSRGIFGKKSKETTS